ncbi:MAG: CCA tRNA nucleotidyltransferase [Alphaproteobacteria bacterium HGW-Alphaproteobacteria-4]|jgi:poly(A) polymerase|nr:MAG: CCA tRNA nucleotidyltransferase [Alphaproteobacteria bacterium HGW-Alphaproteobacteria-4]
MQVFGLWLSEPGLQAVLAMLDGGGHRALLVGGAVRNALLGQAVADIDIATDARPQRVQELCAMAGLRAVPTGIDHGTITVVVAGVGHEVTTFRRDVETFGRHAVVAYADTIEEDAARRDFTMNALYADASGKVIDPLGEGLADLAARRVRFVGAPQDRIREDYLRILRFFRFTAWYGAPEAGPDAEALAACAEHAQGVESLSRERVGAEMRKLLSAADPAPAMAAMQAAGVLAHVLPGADARALAVLVHLEAGRPPDWRRRLAVLGGEGAAEALRLARADARVLAAMRDAAAGPAPALELGYTLGADVGASAVLAHAALVGAALPANWQADVARGAVAKFPLSAADLAPHYSGPALGARLKELEARWVASGFALGRDALLA